MKSSVCSYTSKSSLHKNNEDSHLICEDYIIVADGMGGECSGDIASQIAVETIDSVLSQNIAKVSSESEIRNLLMQAVLSADSKIADYIEEIPASYGMGTTILVAIRKDDELFISWCGDSRCYSYNDGKVTSITKDHSYVQQLIDSGHLTIEESFTHPDNNLITRFVGGGEETCIPEFCKHRLADSELIILCTDGLSGYCRDEDISNAIQNNRDIKELPKQLSDLAISHGCDDDITIIVLSPKSYRQSGNSNSILGWLMRHMHYEVDSK